MFTILASMELLALNGNLDLFKKAFNKLSIWCKDHTVLCCRSSDIVPTMLCSVRIQKSLWNFHSKVQLSETYIIKISWYVCWVKILMCSNCFFNKDWWCVFVDSLASFFFIIGHKFIHNWSFNASYCSCDILSFV